MLKYGILLLIVTVCYPLLKVLYKKAFLLLCFAIVGAFIGTFTPIPIVIGSIIGMLLGMVITYLSLQFDTKPYYM